MPKLTYQPEGAEPQSWEFSFGKLMSPERVVIEKMTGLSWDEVQQGFWKNSTPVVHAMLYVLMKRAHPVMKPTDLEFCDDDYLLEPLPAETRAWLATAQASPEAKRDPEVEAAIAEALAKLDEAEAENPKD